MNGGRTFSEMLAEIEALRAENERLADEIERLRLTLGRMVACPKCRYEPTEAP
jgi:hypothetical protein